MGNKAKQTEDKVDHKEATKNAPLPAGGNAWWQWSLGIVLGMLVFDNLTKLWAQWALRPEWWNNVTGPTAEQFANTPIIQIIPGLLRFAYAENKGAAFSILYGQVTVLGVVSFLAAIGLYFFWRSLPAGEKWGRAAVALIFSGAVGNMIYRFFRGYVVDFIDAYIGAHHWPTFNIADSCICVGATILAIRFLQKKI